jgi:hypothetical protein
MCVCIYIYIFIGIICMFWIVLYTLFTKDLTNTVLVHKIALKHTFLRTLRFSPVSYHATNVAN